MQKRGNAGEEYTCIVILRQCKENLMENFDNNKLIQFKSNDPSYKDSTKRLIFIPFVK